MSESADFGTFGRYRETPVDEMPADMKAAYEHTKQLRGMVPGPHKIWLANPTLCHAIVSTGAYFQAESTLTKPEYEIVVNLINGKWCTAYGNYEHEILGQWIAALAPEKLQALITGLPTSFEDPRQQVVYELTSALISPRVIPLGLYRRAKELIGDAGIVDVTVLIGWFTGVSMTLAAYDVPSNADSTALAQ
jgi:4-carboxymuconolactone decarboxylase